MFCGLREAKNVEAREFCRGEARKKLSRLGKAFFRKQTHKLEKQRCSVYDGRVEIVRTVWKVDFGDAFVYRVALTALFRQSKGLFAYFTAGFMLTLWRGCFEC